MVTLLYAFGTHMKKTTKGWEDGCACGKLTGASTRVRAHDKLFACTLFFLLPAVACLSHAEGEGGVLISFFFCHGQLPVRFWYTQAEKRTTGAGAMAMQEALRKSQVQGGMRMVCLLQALASIFFFCYLLWLA